MSETRKKTRWGRVVLGVSLALNLAVLGAVAGAFWRFDSSHDRAERRGGPAFAAPYVFALPREDRHALRAQLRAGAPEDWRAARAARYEDVLGALRAAPFDRDALAGAVRAQREAAVAGQTAAETAWLARIEAMDPETRAAYADRVEKIVTRKRGRDHKRRKD